MSFRSEARLALAVIAALGAGAQANTWYVSTTGSDLNGGSLAFPFATFSKAISSAVAGDTILARGGTYQIGSTVSIGSSKNGTAANPFTLAAYPGETPVLDFHTQAIGSSARGISIDGNYWRVSGLTVQYAGDNGVFISGSNNIVQQCVARQSQDSGFAIQPSGTRTPSSNLLLNCDSYGNYDIAALGENADGFAVKFRGLGPGNVLQSCRAWNNSDDGYDFWQAENGVQVKNCWSFHNGISASFTGVAGTYAGDGNGIKLGHDSGTHTLTNMLVWGNPAHGIDINGNATALEPDPPTIAHGVTVYNNTSVSNGGKNFNFDEDPTTASPPTNHVLRNNISYNGSVTILSGNTSDHNTWNAGLTALAGDFVSTTDPMTANGLYHPTTDRSYTTTPSYGSGIAIGPRQTDGSLPDLAGFMRLASGSHLVNAGVNVGLPYIGSAPDLGAWEQVPAGNAYWGLSIGGAIEPTSSWIAQVAPTSATTANFALGSSSYTVTFSTSPTHAAVVVHNEAILTFNLNGNTYTQTNSTSDALTVAPASGNTAKLFINNGTLVTNPASGFKAVIGRDAGSNGMIQIGGSATWNVGREVRVGDSGTGAMNLIGTGAQVNVGAVGGSSSLVLGYNAGGSGAMTLGTNTSLSVNGDEIIGRSGSGSVAQSVLSTHTVTGTMTLAANAGSSGQYTMTNGSLSVASLINKGLFDYNGGTLSAGAVQVLSGGRMNVKAGGTRTLSITSLSIDAASRLDLNDNDIVVTYGTNANPFATIQGYVSGGYSATVDPSKTGIISSTGQAAGNTILALFDNALVGRTTFNGATISANSVVGKYTYFGDVNIDGQVTGDDYTVIDANLSTDPALGLDWVRGDANRDSVVTGDDYTIIDSNLGLGVGNPLAPARLSAVPEPAWLGVAAMAVAGLPIRRRRLKIIA